jgi:toxin ParE1/3/4
VAHQIILAPHARRDPTNLYDYLKERAGPRVAQSYIDRLDALFDLLADFPGIGSPRPELGPSIRSTGLWPYVVLYHVGDGTLDILRVVHGRHDITAEILQ